MDVWSGYLLLCSHEALHDIAWHWVIYLDAPAQVLVRVSVFAYQKNSSPTNYPSTGLCTCTLQLIWPTSQITLKTMLGKIPIRWSNLTCTCAVFIALIYLIIIDIKLRLANVLWGALPVGRCADCIHKCIREHLKKEFPLFYSELSFSSTIH